MEKCVQLQAPATLLSTKSLSYPVSEGPGHLGKEEIR